MPSCFVPLCDSGYAAKTKYLKANGLPLPHFFTPQTENQRAKWAMVVKRDKESLTMKSRICSEHFLESDYVTHDKTVLPDGSIHLLPRLRAKLKSNDVVPSIFNKYPTYYQPKVNKRKSPKKRATPVKKNCALVQPLNIDLTKPPEEEISLTALTTEENPQENHDVVDPSPPNSSADNSVWSTCQALSKVVMPIGWVICNRFNDSEKVVVHIDDKTLQVDRSITFKDGESPTVKIKSIDYDVTTYNVNFQSVDDIQKFIHKIDIVRPCQGTGVETKKHSVMCLGGLSSLTLNVKRCKHCHSEKDRLRKIELRKETIRRRQQQKILKHKRQKQALKRSKVNLILKVQRYKRLAEQAMDECKKKNEEVLKEAISSLPQAQQEAVKACFDAARRKGPSGRRYTTEWIYECLLMRIKDKKLYDHIRHHEILVLPCISTINGYLKNYGGCYGFQPQTLQLMKAKSEDLEPCKRHGIILIDEMKLTKGLHFDASTLKVVGMKDMGEDVAANLGEDFHEAVREATDNLPQDPKAPAKVKRREKRDQNNQHKRDKDLGDHALVITFQPFQGQWVQAIGCFLTRGNANDDELTKLVLEAIILLERSGYFADGVVTDGAKWNRSMWTKFGVDRDNVSAEHPCDPERRLFFISDFPHLVKCMRNCFVQKKIINTPEGQINLDHWQAVVDADNIRQVGLREAHKLTQDHLHPDNWQKQNVRMAWEFWSGSSAAAMESYKFQGMDRLQDCGVSSMFCKLVNDLCDALNSNRPQNALWPNSAHTKAIQDFLEYFLRLKKWSDERLREKLKLAEEARVALLKRQGKNPRGSSQSVNQEAFIFSESTDVGLLVTPKGALELCKYLIEKCGFRYVMTARFNQDALERFFGLVRQSCGGNTHPEPRVFAQLFRLLSIYSLVKPIRGSNITGGEMVTTLLNLKDLQAATKEERKMMLSQKLDQIILNGENLDFIPDIVEHIDHDYLGESVDEFALRYVAGFVARNAKKYTNNCTDCESYLQKTPQEKSDADMLITLKSRGGLIYPSDALVEMLGSVEKTVISASLNNEMEENILFVVLEKLETVSVQKIGCSQHDHALTKAILKFFLITRMHFLTKRWNQKTLEQKKKQKVLRKQSHQT